MLMHIWTRGRHPRQKFGQSKVTSFKLWEWLDHSCKCRGSVHASGARDTSREHWKATYASHGRIETEFRKSKKESVMEQEKGIFQDKCNAMKQDN